MVSIANPLTWDTVVKVAAGTGVIFGAAAALWRVAVGVVGLIRADRLALAAVPAIRAELEKLRVQLTAHEALDDQRFTALERRVDERITSLERRIDERHGDLKADLSQVDGKLDTLLIFTGRVQDREDARPRREPR